MKDQDHQELLDLKETIYRLQEENQQLRAEMETTDRGKALLHQKEEFFKLLSVSKQIVSELVLDKVLNLVAENARQIVQADLVLVPMLSEDLNSYTYVAGVGEGADLVCGTSYKAHIGMCGWVLQHEQSLLFGEESPYWLEEKTPWEEGQQSAVLVPLFGRKGIIGGLSALGKKGGGAFTRHDLDLLTMFANQVSISIENAKLVQEMMEKRERIQSLFELSQREWSSRGELADYALEEAVRLTSSKVGYLHFIDEDQQTIQLFSWSKAVHDECSVAKLTHYSLEQAGIWADAARLKKPVIHNDYQNHPNKKGYPEGHFHVVRHMSVPIIDKDKIVAIVGVGNKEKAYDEADVQQLALFMGNMWSILKQKQAELEVRRAKDEWESTFDAIDEIVTIHDTNMKIVQANRSAGVFFNVQPAQLVGKYCYSVFRNKAEPCQGCPEIYALRDHKTCRGEIHHENLGKVFEVSSSPIMNGSHQCIGSVHIAKDITDQKKLEEQLRQSQKMEAIGTMAGGIAHDFNNILAIIIGNADIAKYGIPDEHPASHNIVQILEASNRAKDLVKQILTFSRKADLQPIPVTPCSILKESLKLLRSTTPTSVSIQQDLCKKSCKILADPIQFHQLFMNLFSNAVYAMDEKGTLSVRVKMIDLQPNEIPLNSNLKPGKHLKIMVSDTGSGMDKETQDRIFDPFFTTKDVDEGTGMGLSIVHGIVKNHNGYIGVESKLGEGTTFSILLPIIEDINIQEPKEIVQECPRGNERILFIDDEKMLAEMGQQILESQGYSVTVKTSSTDALETFKNDPQAFDLVITDQSMPNMTGSELSSELISLRPDIPIILCTGFSKKVSEETAKELGIKAYCNKPLDRKSLATVVRKVLD